MPRLAPIARRLLCLGLPLSRVAYSAYISQHVFRLIISSDPCRKLKHVYDLLFHFILDHVSLGYFCHFHGRLGFIFCEFALLSPIRGLPTDHVALTPVTILSAALSTITEAVTPTDRS